MLKYISLQRLTFIAIIIQAALVGSAQANPIQSRADITIPVATFGYTELKGPLHWYGLNKSANIVCAEGKHQSPIVIDSSIGFAPNGSIEVQIPKIDHAIFENEGYTVMLIDTNGTLKDSGKDYSLSQFHFHTPGEHLLQGEFYPMELHFVFQSRDTSKAVMAFSIQLDPLGVAEPLLKEVFAKVTDIANPGTYTTTGPLSFDSLLHHFHSNPIYKYTDSLTTPPCSESVDWLISAEPIPLDVATFNMVKKVLKFNARYPQNKLGQTNLLEVAAHDFGCNI
ncbi:hypothetical protein BZG36_04205 [Bifiguratus adelaidae]|uniref:carbonic anhydrase n=1 Tax=Bifiguratus adelaidae TaxID=1938954 RepID=A0A261XY97_9FUNG|nr:hypothetical protein BZG36_04205 [Bifiguratus adelaidae]